MACNFEIAHSKFILGKTNSCDRVVRIVYPKGTTSQIDKHDETKTVQQKWFRKVCATYPIFAADAHACGKALNRFFWCQSAANRGQQFEAAIRAAMRNYCLSAESDHVQISKASNADFIFSFIPLMVPREPLQSTVTQPMIARCIRHCTTLLHITPLNLPCARRQ